MSGSRSSVISVPERKDESRLAVTLIQVAALLLALRERDLWPPLVPSVVLIECLQGHACTPRAGATCLTDPIPDDTYVGAGLQTRPPGGTKVPPLRTTVA